ncbi:hypothetical protein [Thermococcus nautili]|nr:hypothetical protein [Thermococcus nautili]
MGSFFRREEVVKDRKRAFWVVDKFKEGEMYIFWVPNKPHPKRIRVRLIERTPKKLVFEVITRPKQKLQEKNPNVQKESQATNVTRASAKPMRVQSKTYTKSHKIQKRRNWGQTIWALLKLLLGLFFLAMAIFSFIAGEVVLGIALLIAMAGIFGGGHEEQNSQHNIQPTVYDDDDYYYDYLDELEEDSLIDFMVYYLDD